MLPTAQQIEGERRWLEKESDAEISNAIHGQVLNEAKRLAAIQIRNERLERAEADREAKEMARQDVVIGKLDKLARPSLIEKWTLTFVIGTFLATLILIIIAWVSWRNPKIP